jgi:hypothetical protein
LNVSTFAASFPAGPLSFSAIILVVSSCDCGRRLSSGPLDSRRSASASLRARSRSKIPATSVELPRWC